MKIYKTKWFHRWAAKEGLNAAVLRAAIVEMEQGLADALGGYLCKKRIAIPGRGNAGRGAHVGCLPAGSSAFFIYGYPKNERANVTDRELGALRLLAKELLGYSEQQLATAIQAGELFEMNDDGKA